MSRELRSDRRTSTARGGSKRCDQAQSLDRLRGGMAWNPQGSTGVLWIMQAEMMIRRDIEELMMTSRWVVEENRLRQPLRRLPSRLRLVSGDDGAVTRVLAPAAAATLAATLCACSPSTEAAGSSGGGPPDSHACARSGVDSGIPDRTIPYNEADATGTEEGAVVGSVYDLEGAPVESAFVGLGRPDSPEEGPGTLTDAEGRFRFGDVPPGDHLLEIRHPGFLAQIHQLQLLPGRTDTLCIALRARALAPPDFDPGR